MLSSTIAPTHGHMDEGDSGKNGSPAGRIHAARAGNQTSRQAAAFHSFIPLVVDQLRPAASGTAESIFVSGQKLWVATSIRPRLSS